MLQKKTKGRPMTDQQREELYNDTINNNEQEEKYLNTIVEEHKELYVIHNTESTVKYLPRWCSRDQQYASSDWRNSRYSFKALQNNDEQRRKVVWTQL